MMSDDSLQITFRPVAATDAPFLTRCGPRLFPGATASPRDADRFRAFFDHLTSDTLSSVSDGMSSIAELNGEPAGVVAAHLDVDYFTKHSRLYVDTVVVANEAEGRGVGRSLMAFIENRARELGCREVVLDVFASTTQARGPHETCGYAADHMRMAKPLD